MLMDVFGTLLLFMAWPNSIDQELKMDRLWEDQGVIALGVTCICHAWSVLGSTALTLEICLGYSHGKSKPASK
jgi:hypothetical protein